MKHNFRYLVRNFLLQTVLLTAITGLLLSQEKMPISEDLFFTEIQDSVFIITHHFPRYGANSLFVLLAGKQGMLIDTPNELSGTLSLLDWIESEFGDLDITAINTGWHNDNLGGNEILIASNIPVYGPIRTAELIDKHGESLRQLLMEETSGPEDRRFYQSWKSVNFTPPDQLFPIEDGLKLEKGGEVFDVYFPGESHTTDNTVVYLQKRKILFGGCMILSMQHMRPGFTEHANMDEWPVSVKNVNKKYPSCNLVIPGHGPPGSQELLEHTVAILEKYLKEIRN